MTGLIAVVDGSDRYNWLRLARQFDAIYAVPAWENDGWDVELANEVEDALITARAHGARAQAGAGGLTTINFTIAGRWLSHGGGSRLTEVRAPLGHHSDVRALMGELGFRVPLLRPA
nr:hypothetical protein [Microbacterium barkeri]